MMIAPSFLAYRGVGTAARLRIGANTGLSRCCWRCLSSPPYQRHLIERADDTGLVTNNCAGGKAEFRDADQPFLQGDAHFAACEVRARAGVDALAKGRMQSAATAEVDTHRIRIQ